MREYACGCGGAGGGAATALRRPALAYPAWAHTHPISPASALLRARYKGNRGPCATRPVERMSLPGAVLLLWGRALGLLSWVLALVPRPRAGHARLDLFAMLGVVPGILPLEYLCSRLRVPIRPVARLRTGLAATHQICPALGADRIVFAGRLPVATILSDLA